MSDESANEDRTTRAEPQSFRARSLSVSLTVNDLEKSLTWYHEIVGFAVDERHESEGKLRAVSLVAGDIRMIINQDDGAKGWERVKGEGFALYITTAQSVDDMAAQIKERGGVLEAEPADMPWGARVFRLKDPDGFKIAIAAV